MKRLLTGAALLPLVIACGVVRPARQEAVATETTRAAVATYAMGTALTRDGAIAAESAGDSFRRGPEIYLAIDVASASAEQKIDVEWLDASGRVARQETRIFPEGTRYAHFGTGDTSAWRAGACRAVITINDRKVNETRFALI